MKASKQQGWSFWARWRNVARVRRCACKEVRMWHFSGTDEFTQPWMFLDIPTAKEVRKCISKTLFHARDPGGVVAAAVAEWREALDELLCSKAGGGEVCALRSTVNLLASQTAMRRRRLFLKTAHTAALH